MQTDRRTHQPSFADIGRRELRRVDVQPVADMCTAMRDAANSGSWDEMRAALTYGADMLEVTTQALMQLNNRLLEVEKL